MILYKMGDDADLDALLDFGEQTQDASDLALISDFLGIVDAEDLLDSSSYSSVVASAAASVQNTGKRRRVEEEDDEEENDEFERVAQEQDFNAVTPVDISFLHDFVIQNIGIPNTNVTITLLPDDTIHVSVKQDMRYFSFQDPSQEYGSLEANRVGQFLYGPESPLRLPGYSFVLAFRYNKLVSYSRVFSMEAEEQQQQQQQQREQQQPFTLGGGGAFASAASSTQQRSQAQSQPEQNPELVQLSKRLQDATDVSENLPWIMDNGSPGYATRVQSVWFKLGANSYTYLSIIYKKNSTNVHQYLTFRPRADLLAYGYALLAMFRALPEARRVPTYPSFFNLLDVNTEKDNRQTNPKSRRCLLEFMATILTYVVSQAPQSQDNLWKSFADSADVVAYFVESHKAGKFAHVVRASVDVNYDTRSVLFHERVSTPDDFTGRPERYFMLMTRSNANATSVEFAPGSSLPTPYTCNHIFRLKSSTELITPNELKKGIVDGVVTLNERGTVHAAYCAAPRKTLLTYFLDAAFVVRNAQNRVIVTPPNDLYESKIPKVLKLGYYRRFRNAKNYFDYPDPDGRVDVIVVAEQDVSLLMTLASASASAHAQAAANTEAPAYDDDDDINDVDTETEEQYEDGAAATAAV